MVIGLSSASSNLNPPYKQLLVGLRAGAGSMFHAGGGRRVSVMWHREGGLLVLTCQVSPSVGLLVPLHDLLSLTETLTSCLDREEGWVWVWVVPCRRLSLPVV